MQGQYDQNKDIRDALDAVGGKMDGMLGQMSNTARVKADFKPEIFFIGQIVGGTDFPTD